MYTVFDEDFDDCWLVDIGDYVRTEKAIPKGKKIKGLLLTHIHFDHIYGINELCQHHPECDVYTSAYGKEALMDDRKNLSRYHEYTILFRGEHLVVVGEGDKLLLMMQQKITEATISGH